MALRRETVILTTSDQDIYTCPAGIDASAHGISWSNTTSTDRVVTIKFFNSVLNTTQTLLSATASANKTYSFPKPVNMRAGDKIIATAAANSAITMVVSAYEDSSVVSVGFTPVGTWSSSTTYTQNQVVFYTDSAYVATSTSGNTNKTPNTEPTYWVKLSNIPAIALNATPVVTLNPTQTPTVTNSGTSMYPVYQFGLPRARTFNTPSITTGAAGSSASVSQTFDGSGDVNLSFTIPRGDTGATGSAATLTVGTTTTVNPNVNPSVTNAGTTSAADFRFSLPRAATVTIGTVTTVTPSTSATVTNSGTNGDVVLNFSVPKGDPGAGSMSLLETNTFSTAGTFTNGWTKNANAKLILVYAVGAGGGGASSGAGANTGYGGSGGGGAGATVRGMFPASILGSTETVIVGTKGAGGASVTFTAAGANGGVSGNPGGVGGDSSFGAWLKAEGGNGGTLNTSNAAIGGGAVAIGLLAGYTIPIEIGGAGTDGSATDNNPLATTTAAATVFMSSGGGSGGSVGAAATAVNGLAGAAAGSVSGGTAGTGSTTQGGATAGGNGSNNAAGTQGSGGGGGGNCATAAGSATAGAGGNGGVGAGGGGGGGARVATTAGNVATSGKGGDGGDGLIIIYQFG